MLYSADNRPPAVDDFYSRVHRALVELGAVEPDAEFKPRESSEPEMPKILGLESAARAEPAMVAASRAMGSEPTRDALLHVKRGLLSSIDELVKGKARAATLSQEEFSHLVEVGLLEVEYAVLCKGTSTRVYATTNRDEITESTNRCLQCDQRIASHDIVQIAAATPLCDQLLVKSRWMRVLVVEVLLESGIPPEHILIPAAESGSDEIDLAFMHERSFILAELKDSDFGQGDASYFSIRVKQIDKVNQGLIVVTGSVDAPARSALATMFPADRRSSLLEPAVRINILEGHSSFDSALREFLTEGHIATTIASLSLCGPAAGLNLVHLIRHKLGIS